MIASLMMYARPELDAENTAYWAVLRDSFGARGIKTPETMDNTRDEFEVWLSPDLVFSQTCGLPYRATLAEQVTLIGTANYALEGCPAGYYNSVVLVRADDPRERAGEFADARFVFNQDCSQSGYGAAYLWARDHGFWFSDRQASGAHTQSARMVAQGEADIAVVDAQTWRFIQRFDSFAKDLRVIDRTEPSPGLAYISAKGAHADLMCDAVAEAIENLDPAHRTSLCLEGIVKVPQAAYLAVENPPV
ncbi:phosphate/phosphite/phosphonate ABC transporter substrate-binding protein [Sulfitobacter geojensis]|uniref:phosphate/phosphite/phosphonate ABC transporter substrate-binding protein n=1 Tax=Sulfitobacter geojensis TaxID=1342299 RepID=UPI0036D812E7